MLRHKLSEFIERLPVTFVYKTEFDSGADNPGKLSARELPYEQVRQVRHIANIGLLLKDRSGLSEGVGSDEVQESVFVPEPDIEGTN